MKGRLLTLILLFVGSSAIIKAQDEKFKAIFVYNFIRQINWPQKPENYVIYVIGNSPIFQELEGIANTKTIDNAKIKIIKIRSVNEISKCQIIYVASEKTELISELFRKSKTENFLIISEKSNACNSGSGINFQSTNGKLAFEISKTNIESCGLQVSNYLLNLATHANN